MTSHVKRFQLLLVFSAQLLLLNSYALPSSNKNDFCRTTAEGTLCIPITSFMHPENQKQVRLGHVSSKQPRYYSNYTIFKPKAALSSAPIETPPSLACIYGLTPYVSGCPINGTTAVPITGGGTIAIVDYGNNDELENDLKVFSEQYGLPLCTTLNGCFKKVHTGSSFPPDTDDHGGEQHIDVEWAHAMAPNAKIILVEGDVSEPVYSLVDKANEELAAVGGGIVSISIASAEYENELTTDSHYQSPGVIYISSSGDFGTPARYPASSPYVIAAGGTETVRDGNGNFVEEVVWNHNGGNSSGGPSIYEPRPSYQDSVQKIVGTQRGTPDISFVAYSVSIYNSTPGSECGGWCAANGTSISAPALAGIINSANKHFSSSQQELNYIYSSAVKGAGRYWHDITKGHNFHQALSGYDFCTGLGSPLGYEGK